MPFTKPCKSTAMELIQKDAEQHALATVERLSGAPQGWLCFSFPFSAMLDIGALAAGLSGIPEKIAEVRARRDLFLSSLEKAGAAFNGEGYAYAFADMDVFILLHAGDRTSGEQANALYREMKALMPEETPAEAGILSTQTAAYQNFVNKKLLGAKKQAALAAMADRSKTGDLADRRRHREEPLVMIVEDDRFTAHYAASFLSREFGLLLHTTGEEAIAAYVESAPDAILIDIHLPGLGGHQVLEAIRAVDPGAFIIMLSADSIMDNILRAAEHGANKFLKKPFDRARMIETIKSSPHLHPQKRKKDPESMLI